MKNIKYNLKMLVLAVGVVFVWRGVWGLSDLYLFPGNQVMSYVISILIGLVVLYINDRKLDELS